MLYRPKFRFLAALLAACLLTLTLVPVAYGAGADAGGATATNSTIDATALANVPVVTQEGITNFQGMEVVHVINTQDQNSDYMWVMGILPDAAPLPAKVQLAVPKGAQVTWLGEIDFKSGGEQTIAPGAPVTKGDQDIYTITATKYRTVRAEFPMANPFKASTTSTGTAVMTAVLSYKPISNLMFLYLGAEVPANLPVLSPDFQDGGTMPSGNHVYLATFSQVKAGQNYQATLTYAKSSSTKDPTNPLVIIAIVALVVAVAALLFILLRRRFGSAEEQ